MGARTHSRYTRPHKPSISLGESVPRASVLCSCIQVFTFKSLISILASLASSAVTFSFRMISRIACFRFALPKARLGYSQISMSSFTSTLSVLPEKVMKKRGVNTNFLLHETKVSHCFSIYQNAGYYMFFNIQYNVLPKHCT